MKTTTPGELLLEEFMKPMEISAYRLAKEIDVSAQRIDEIIKGRRRVTADTDLRLCRFLCLSDGYWLRAQAAFDIEVTQANLVKLYKRSDHGVENNYSYSMRSRVIIITNLM